MVLPLEQLLGILSLAGVTGAVPTIINILLQKKGANKKLELEEGGLGVQQFQAIMSGYQDQLDRSEDTIKNIQKDLETVKSREEAVRGFALELKLKMDRMRTLMLRYVQRVGIPMDAEELAEFDQTKPTNDIPGYVNREKS